MIWKASIVLSLALGVLSDRRPAISEQKIELFAGHHGDLSHIGQHEPEHHDVYAWAYPSYEFSYHVDDPHTHDIKGQHEIRDGDEVRGNYWLIQPDGRKRTVKYSSDHKSGFHAEVDYQPLDGHHYEVNKHQNYKDHTSSEHGQRDGWDGDYSRRRRLEVDDRRHDGRGDRRDNDDKGKHDDKRDNRDNSWGWLRPRQERIDDHREGRKDDIGGRRLGYGENWKGGVLVGWSEGRDRDHISRARNDRHNVWDYDDKDNDKRNDGSHDDRRGQRPYHVPLTNFKPLVPYGQRLH